MATRQGGTRRPESTLRGRQVPQKRPFPLVPVLIGVGVLLAVAAGAWLFFGDNTSRVPAAEKSPGGPVATMPSREHVPDGTRVQYSTNPPTSGDHWQGPATWASIPADRLRMNGWCITWNMAA